MHQLDPQNREQNWQALLDAVKADTAAAFPTMDRNDIRSAVNGALAHIIVAMLTPDEATAAFWRAVAIRRIEEGLAMQPISPAADVTTQEKPACTTSI